MNPDLDKLHPYPFENLHALKAGITPPVGLKHIALSIGEPQHAAAEFIAETLTQNIAGLSSYPITRGLPELRLAIVQWLARRYHLLQQSLDAEKHVLPVNGTREALFAFAQMGNTDYRRCVVFHSLSKRSNLPGLRSGFVAGDAEIIHRFLQYRTYHGCAMPLHHQ